MLNKELLQMALDALEQYKKYTRGVMIPSTHCTGNAAITALRSALAAPAPADTEGCVACVTCGQPWPAAPVVREPLTDDFIWLLWTRACEKPRLTRDLVCDFARANEGGGK